MAQAFEIHPEAQARSPRPVSELIGRFAPLIFLVLMMSVFAVLEPRFLDPTNLFNVMRQISITGLIALGMTFVILTAGIDLSVGSMLALSGIVAAAIAKGTTGNTLSLDPDQAGGYGWFAALSTAVGIGVLCGFIQGFAITRLKVPPFVVTLGGLSAFRGLTLWFSGGGPISGFDADLRWWGQGLIGPVPVPVILFLSCAVVCHIVLRHTRYGRNVYAVGGNPEAARLSGLPVNRIILSVYVIVGFFAGLAGFVLNARLNSAEAVAGQRDWLTGVASGLLGGTSLFGGAGSVGGTVVGAVLIGVLVNGLVLNNVSSYIQQVIIGLIIILAVAFDRYVKSRRQA